MRTLILLLLLLATAAQAQHLNAPRGHFPVWVSTNQSGVVTSWERARRSVLSTHTPDALGRQWAVVSNRRIDRSPWSLGAEVTTASLVVTYTDMEGDSYEVEYTEVVPVDGWQERAETRGKRRRMYDLYLDAHKHESRLRELRSLSIIPAAQRQDLIEEQGRKRDEALAKAEALRGELEE